MGDIIVRTSQECTTDHVQIMVNASRKGNKPEFIPIMEYIGELPESWQCLWSSRIAERTEAWTPRWTPLGKWYITPGRRKYATAIYYKSALKLIFIRCGSHGYSAKIHSLKLCSHVGFCVRDGHVPSLVRGVCRNYSCTRYGLYWGLSRSRAVTVRVAGVFYQAIKLEPKTKS